MAEYAAPDDKHKMRSSQRTISRSPKHFPRPDVFDEIQLGPYVTKVDAKLAQIVWSEADTRLGRHWKRMKGRPYTDTRAPITEEVHVLVNNVYEHLMSRPFLPTSAVEAVDFQDEFLFTKLWNTAEIITPFKKDIILGSPIKTIAVWETKAIKDELTLRGLKTAGSRDRLIARLVDDEVETHCGIMRMSNLSHWGIKRPEKYVLQPAKSHYTNALDMYTFAIHLSPYNPAYWTSRAYCWYQLAHFDMALGDAWRAKILCDVLLKEDEHSRRPGLYPRVWHAIEQHFLADPRKGGSLKPELLRMRQSGVDQFITPLMKAIDNISTLCLLGVNSGTELRAGLFEGDTVKTRLRDEYVPELRKRVTLAAQTAYDKRPWAPNLFWHERFTGAISARERYPFNQEDLDRTEPSFLAKLNKYVFQSSGPNINVRQITTPRENFMGLEVCAKKPINKGDLIYFEEPTIRSHLPPRRMALDETAKQDEVRCENCQTLIPKRDVERAAKLAADKTLACKCLMPEENRPSTDGKIFCKTITPEGMTCLQIARQNYHFTSCGKDWTWLYDTMRSNIANWQGLEHISHSNEHFGTTMSLLLRNVFEITLHRREKSGDPYISPHEIDELLVLDDQALSWSKSYFPFTLRGNIVVPFDILQCLGVDIFRDLTFDTWAIQIVMRKLLTNVVPWEHRRRGNVPDMLHTDQFKYPQLPNDQDLKIKQKTPFTDWDPSFPNLYLFPGLSMFNHACRGKNNADWGYDKKVPNRVVVWATEDIAAGQQISIRYRYGKFRSQNRAIRFFGDVCDCPACKEEVPPPTYDPKFQLPSPYYDSDQSILTGQFDTPKHQQVAPQNIRRFGEYAEIEDGRVVIRRRIGNEGYGKPQLNDGPQGFLMDTPRAYGKTSREERKRRTGETDAQWKQRLVAFDEDKKRKYTKEQESNIELDAKKARVGK
ncbi:hypothetical protein N7495_002805 [Penicillium taxi]|uniref:uncharacterized protein n=1 Tax=Penicillium taxi TaxID=168475 RepID=UPI0025453933|nr:uncharacterized protein N7495_002805 [Penicillium taxi]KAJ5902277.1 hypothetical protein N7495_002805 [Penicillium taxi]